MRRALRLVLFAFLAANAALAGWILYALRWDRHWLIDVREALFSSAISQPVAFDAPPQALIAAGFLTDPPELVAAWRERLAHDVEYMRDAPEALAGRDELDTVRALVLRFSKNGGGACGHYRDLLDNIQRLPRGEGLGCCSDHVQVLIALGSTLGLFIRQVHHVEHTMAEVWVPALGKWVFVDPQYAVMVREPGGAYLSLREIRARYQAGAPVEFEFIGNEHHRFATTRPQDFEYYDAADDFRVIGTLWGNNVFEEDRLDRRLGLAPRAARQLVGLSLGALPAQRILDDGDAHARVAQLQGKRRRYLGVLALLAAGTLVPLAGLGLVRPGARLAAEKPRR